jgi:hypothetical protein
MLPRSAERATDSAGGRVMKSMKRESKPAWADVPPQLKEELATLAGGPIADAAVAWGGYGPSATFILTTADRRKLFCKGTHPGFTEAGKVAFHTDDVARHLLSVRRLF